MLCGAGLILRPNKDKLNTIKNINAIDAIFHVFLLFNLNISDSELIINVKPNK